MLTWLTPVTQDPATAQNPGGLNLVTRYAYDELGERLSQTDANQHATTYTYDAMGRRKTRSLPLGQSESYSYDADGNLTSRVDFNGRTTSYQYDPNNRLTKKVPDAAFAAPSVVYTYSATGKRLSMVDTSGTTSYSYDLRDRLTQKATPFGAINYTYDAAGNLATLASANPNGAAMSYAYDADNRLQTVTDGSGQTTYAYDGAGNLASFAYPNGVATSYQYDALNRLTSMNSANAGTTLASYAYTLGPAGNRTSVTELSGRTVQYSYDNLYRLTSEAIACGTGDPACASGTVGYTYDSVGNRLSMSSTAPAIPAGTFFYDANDRLQTDQYDANGNTTGSGGIGNAYDFENHLIQHGNVVIVYDGDGNRVQETAGGVTTSYLVSDVNPTGYVQVLDELVGGSVARSYSYGLERISERQTIGGTPTTSFYGYDGHGSVRFLTNSAGAVTDRYTYDAFGNLIEQTGSTPNLYLYAGQQFDPDLGLYYNRARYLDVRSGRFWGMDPVGDPRSLHNYLYVGADPVNSTDPTGKFELVEFSFANALRNELNNININNATELMDHILPKDSSIRTVVKVAFGVALVAALVGGAVKVAGKFVSAEGSAALPDILIAEEKLGYLLAETSGKSEGFALFGYTAENVSKLEEVLAFSRTMIGPQTETEVTQYGTKYIVNMEIVGPNGVPGLIRVVWQQDIGSTIYRFITAIPKPSL